MSQIASRGWGRVLLTSMGAPTCSRARPHSRRVRVIAETNTVHIVAATAITALKTHVALALTLNAQEAALFALANAPPPVVTHAHALRFARTGARMVWLCARQAGTALRAREPFVPQGTIVRTNPKRQFLVWLVHTRQRRERRRVLVVPQEPIRRRPGKRHVPLARPEPIKRRPEKRRVPPALAKSESTYQVAHLLLRSARRVWVVNLKQKLARRRALNAWLGSLKKRRGSLCAPCVRKLVTRSRRAKLGVRLALRANSKQKPENPAARDVLQAGINRKRVNLHVLKTRVQRGPSFRAHLRRLRCARRVRSARLKQR